MTATCNAFTYVLPIRAERPVIDEGFTDYLAWISERAELIVVDGSSHQVFTLHDQHWGKYGTHIVPRGGTINGKVANVMTGVQLATHERVVIADDDVRFGDEIERIVSLLDEAEVVRPQNFFDPLPWHAVWDSGRILINRVSGGDWPGTLAVRRSTLLAAGGYAGDVMFENYELAKTVEAVGGRHLLATDLFVRRIPPTLRQFLTQRTRQAYDEFARPCRLAAFLPIAPIFGGLALMRRRKALLHAAASTVVFVTVAAEIGRQHGGATARFPARCSLAAPLWLAERSICVWTAVWARVRGGVLYRDCRIRRAALSEAERQRRIAAGQHGQRPPHLQEPTHA